MLCFPAGVVKTFGPKYAKPFVHDASESTAAVVDLTEERQVSTDDVVDMNTDVVDDPVVKSEVSRSNTRNCKCRCVALYALAT